MFVRGTFLGVQRTAKDIAFEPIGENAPKLLTHLPGGQADDLAALGPAANLVKKILGALAPWFQSDLLPTNTRGDRFQRAALEIYPAHEHQVDRQAPHQDRGDPSDGLADLDMPANLSPRVQEKQAEAFHACYISRNF